MRASKRKNEVFLTPGTVPESKKKQFLQQKMRDFGALTTLSAPHLLFCSKQSEDWSLILFEDQ